MYEIRFRFIQFLSQFILKILQLTHFHYVIIACHSMFELSKSNKPNEIFNFNRII